MALLVARELERLGHRREDDELVGQRPTLDARVLQQTLLPAAPADQGERQRHELGDGRTRGAEGGEARAEHAREDLPGTLVGLERADAVVEELRVLAGLLQVALDALARAAERRLRGMAGQEGDEAALLQRKAGQLLHGDAGGAVTPAALRRLLGLDVGRGHLHGVPAPARPTRPRARVGAVEVRACAHAKPTRQGPTGSAMGRAPPERGPPDSRSVSRILSLGSHPSARPTWTSAGSLQAVLLGLAPGGVCLAAVSPRRRCALTAPFHPCLCARARHRRCVSVALSRGFPRVGSPTTSPCGVRTFLEGPKAPATA